MTMTIIIIIIVVFFISMLLALNMNEQVNGEDKIASPTSKEKVLTRLQIIYKCNAV